MENIFSIGAIGFRRIHLKNDGNISVDLKGHRKRQLAQAFSKNYFFASSKIISDAFSAIIMVGAFVFPETRVGIIDASTTRSP